MVHLIMSPCQLYRHDEERNDNMHPSASHHGINYAESGAELAVVPVII